MEIYPAIDLKGGCCVRLSQGDFDRVTTYGEDPVKIALQWKAAGAPWLHIVDLDGAKTGTQSDANIAALKEIIRQTGLPVQFGGGVRSREAVERMLSHGVARTVMGTAATGNPEMMAEIFGSFGDKVAVGVDARDGMVAVHGWQTSSGELATEFVQRLAAIGASRFIFTDISRDGMLQGINFESLEAVAAAVPAISITASGGVATIEDIRQLLAVESGTSPNVDAVIIGKALYAGTVQLEDVMALAGAC